MRFKLHCKKNDWFVILADTIKEIRDIGAKECNRRGWNTHCCQVEELK